MEKRDRTFSKEKGGGGGQDGMDADSDDGSGYSFQVIKWMKKSIINSFLRMARKRDTTTTMRGMKVQRTAICFPLEENYHLSERRDIPELSESFLDTSSWMVFCRDYLTRGMEEGGHFLNSRGEENSPLACILDSGVDGNDDKSDGSLPRRLTDVVTLDALLSSDKNTRIYSARASSTSSCSPSDKSSITEVQIVVKMMILNSYCEGEDSDGGGSSVDRNGDDDNNTTCYFNTRVEKNDSSGRRSIYCCPAWLEPIIFSRTYPRKFLGNALVYDGVQKVWCSLLFMPLYRGTIFRWMKRILQLYQPGSGCQISSFITSTLTTDNNDDNDNNDNNNHHSRRTSVETKQLPWPQIISATIVQLILFTLPTMKKNGLILHGDLKIDNITYTRTSIRYLYVKVKNTLRGDLFYAIPTCGRLLYLIDFGLSSLRLSSSPKEVEEGKNTVMDISSISERMYDGEVYPYNNNNKSVDQVQFSYSMLLLLMEYFGIDIEKIYSLDRRWWMVIDLLTILAKTDDGQGVLNMKKNKENWIQVFYYNIRKKCHFYYVEEFLKRVSDHFSCKREVYDRVGNDNTHPDTKSDVKIEYDISILSSPP